MEAVNIPLSKLTFAQKLDLMETIWDDLSKEDKEFKSPDWHGEILVDRERAVKLGIAQFSNWADAKERIRNKVS